MLKLKRYKIYIDCARRACFEVDGDNEEIAEDNALEFMNEENFEERIAFIDNFGSWKINQVEEI